MKLVIRLLDGNGDLLGWCEHQAAVKGDGCLRANRAVGLTVDVAGRPAWVSVHWADVNVETRVPYPLNAKWVGSGQTLLLYPGGSVLMECGSMPANLPPVTMKSPARVFPLTGGIGATGSA